MPDALPKPPQSKGKRAKYEVLPAKAGDDCSDFKKNAYICTGIGVCTPTDISYILERGDKRE